MNPPPLPSPPGTAALPVDGVPPPEEAREEPPSSRLEHLTLQEEEEEEEEGVGNKATPTTTTTTTPNNNDNSWDALLPAAVTRHILSFLSMRDLASAVSVSTAWRGLLLLDEVCEDLAATATIYRGLPAHVKGVIWPDPPRSYHAFLSGYRRCVAVGREESKWWNRYKVTFLLSIPTVLQRKGPATVWTVENASWRFESGLLSHTGFAFSVPLFSVNNWLSIPLQSGPLEALITNPDSTFLTEACLLDKHTGKFARLYQTVERDVALGRTVEVENLAPNDAVSAIHIKEPFKACVSTHTSDVRTRLRYVFTSYDWTTECARLKCQGCWLDLDGIRYGEAGGGGGGDGEEQAEEAWVTLKRWVEGLSWV